MKEGSISVVEFKEPKTWVLGEREVSITKIETSTHTWSSTTPEEKILESLDPMKVAHNVIKNVALMSSGSFMEVNNQKLVARIQDLTGTTLIRTQWIFPIALFDNIVYNLTFKEKIPENKFHIIGKDLQ